MDVKRTELCVIGCYVNHTRKQFTAIFIDSNLIPNNVALVFKSGWV